MPQDDQNLKDKILAEATRLFVARGYNGISMREIAEALNVSKAALYYHYRNKQDLMIAILQDYLEEIDRLFLDPLSTERSARQRIRHMVEVIFSLPPERRAVIRLASQEMGQLDPQIRIQFGELYHQKFIGHIEAVLKAGVVSGELRAMDTATATWILLGMMYPFFYGEGLRSAVQTGPLIEQIVDLFLNGASA